MKAGNLGLWAVAAFIGWAGWIMLDMQRPMHGNARGGMMSRGALQEELKAAKVPVLVEFYADWCPPCREVGPVVEALSSEVGSRARVVRINVDREPKASAEHGIEGIPTFIVFKEGREQRREVGAIPKRVMLEMLGL